MGFTLETGKTKGAIMRPAGVFKVSDDLFAVLRTVQFNKVIKRYTAVCISTTIGRMIFASSPVNINIRTIHIP